MAPSPVTSNLPAVTAAATYSSDHRHAGRSGPMFKRVLVPLDGNPQSAAALPLARVVARAGGGHACECARATPGYQHDHSTCVTERSTSFVVRPGGRRVATLRAVLAPVDGTVGGAQALDEAVGLAHQTGAALVVLRAVPPTERFGFDPLFPRHTRRAQRRQSRSQSARTHCRAVRERSGAPASGARNQCNTPRRNRSANREYSLDRERGRCRSDRHEHTL
jgi:nucleotide-binding universal stress UspA family protein